MKRYVVISLMVLVLLSDEVLGSEKDKKTVNVPLLATSKSESTENEIIYKTIYEVPVCKKIICGWPGCIFMTVAVSAVLGYCGYLVLNPGPSGPDPIPPYDPNHPCPDDGTPIDNFFDIHFVKDDVDGYPYPEVCSLYNQGFHNNTQAREYARNKIVEACPILAQARICFNRLYYPYHDHCLKFETDVINSIKSKCHGTRNTRNALARMNTAHNRNTQQPKQQKQNFRQHMRGRNMRG